MDVRKICERGAAIKARHGHVYAEASCIVGAQGRGLKELLLILTEVRPELLNLGVTTIEISALMEREEQVSGELDADEIALLAELSAHFSWSVLKAD